MRFGLIGSSPIAHNFAEALHAHPEAELIGAYSRDPRRAEQATAAMGGTHPFTSLEALTTCPEVDAVYIASPNALHARQALQCIQAGKHVLVEKPFCTTQAHAAAVFQAAHKQGVVAMEAMRPLHDPAFLQMADTLKQIGTIHRATLRFGKRSSRYEDLLAQVRSNIFDCTYGGGALMDMGIYSIETMLYLFGSPQSVDFAPLMLPKHTQYLTSGALDGAGTILAHYNSCSVALFYSKITMDHGSTQFEGERGTLCLDSLSQPSRMELFFAHDIQRGDAKQSGLQVTDTVSTSLPSCENTMIYELSDFIQAVKAQPDVRHASEQAAQPLTSMDRYEAITLEALSLTDELRNRAGIIFPSDTAPC